MAPIDHECLGSLAIALADVKPYANGSKVTLVVGNPTTATVTGFKVKLEWGSVDENGNPANEAAKSKDVTFVETLSGGSWTKMSAMLQLGFVRV